MASEAEIDLVVSTAGTLSQLERQLSSIIRTAESSADPIGVQAALQARESVRALDAQLGRVITAVQATAPDIEIDVDLDEESIRRFREQVDALEGSSRKLGSTQGGTNRRIALYASIVAGAIPALNSMLQVTAATAAALEQVGPAAAVGASALVAVGLTAGTVQLAMVGVSDAIAAAFDPDVKSKDLQAALGRLAPEARKFVKELRSMRTELEDLQQGVQSRVFVGLAGALRSLNESIGSDLSDALNRTGDSLNQMALSAIGAASQLGRQGVFGQALTGANTALEFLEQAPARALRSFTFLAAGASPALNRIALAVDSVSLRVQNRLQRAFESGGLERAVDQAVSVLAEFGRTLRSFGEGFGNIFGVVNEGGEGLFIVLSKVSKAFADVTATNAFQDALRALSQTANVIVSAVLPLLSQALQALGPIFKALAGPAKLLTETLSGVLGDILTALTPVLEAAAKAVGDLVVAFAPLLRLVGDLIAALLPSITPVFEAFSKVFQALAPAVKVLAEGLSAFLVPILERLGPFIEAALVPFVKLYETVAPKVADVLEQLRPSFERLGVAVGRVLELLGPLAVKVVELGLKLLGDLLPAVRPLIDSFVTLADGALRGLAMVLEQVVIPALEIVSKFLEGDFRGAVEQTTEITRNLETNAGRAVLSLRDKAVSTFNQMATRVLTKAQEIRNGVVLRIANLVNDVVSTVRELPGRVVSAVGDLGSALFDAGVQLIAGLAAGIQARVGDLLSQAASIANSIKSTIDGALEIQSPSRVMMETGRNIVQGLQIGIEELLPSLERTAGALAFAGSGGAASNLAVSVPAGRPAAPTNIYLGNELVARYVDGRVTTIDNRNRRILAQGVRR